MVLFLFATGCRLGGPRIPPELMDQDYYFDGSYVQIQGTANLPPVQENVPVNSESILTQEDGNTKTSLRFLTLVERRKLCRDDALRHSHTKWLSLTVRDREVQDEWLLRLRMGAAGPWAGCLRRAVVRNHFYDQPGTCRVVVLYPCLPQEY